MKSDIEKIKFYICDFLNRSARDECELAVARRLAYQLTFVVPGVKYDDKISFYFSGKKYVVERQKDDSVVLNGSAYRVIEEGRRNAYIFFSEKEKLIEEVIEIKEARLLELPKEIVDSLGEITQVAEE